MSKISSKTGISAIAGLLAFIVTVLVLFVPFKGEPSVSLIDWGSDLGIIVIVLFGITIVLYIIAIFRKELDFIDKKIILEQRQQYMPLFRDAVDKMLNRIKELSVEAGKLPLEQYFEKFLKYSRIFERQYKLLGLTHKDQVVRRKVAIMTSLGVSEFRYKNTYLYELEDKDSTIIELKKEYTNYLSRTSDKTLTKYLKLLFKNARKLYSGLTIAEIVKNNDIPFKDPKYLKSYYEKPETLNSFVEIYHKWVNERFDYLIGGRDL